MKFTSTLVTIVAVLPSADAKKDKEEDVEMVDVDTKLVVDYPTYFPTYAPTVSEDEVSSKCSFMANSSSKLHFFPLTHLSFSPHLQKASWAMI